MVNHQDVQDKINSRVDNWLFGSNYDNPGGFGSGFENMSQAEELLAGTCADKVMEILAIKVRVNGSSFERYAGDIAILENLGFVESYTSLGETRIGLSGHGEEYLARQIVKKPEATRVLAEVKKNGKLGLNLMEIYHRELSVMENVGILQRDISSEEYRITEQGKEYLNESIPGK